MCQPRRPCTTAAAFCIVFKPWSSCINTINFLGPSHSQNFVGEKNQQQKQMRVTSKIWWERHIPWLSFSVIQSISAGLCIHSQLAKGPEGLRADCYVLTLAILDKLLLISVLHTFRLTHSLQMLGWEHLLPSIEKALTHLACSVEKLWLIFSKTHFTHPSTLSLPVHTTNQILLPLVGWGLPDSTDQPHLLPGHFCPRTTHADYKLPLTLLISRVYLKNYLFFKIDRLWHREH